MAARLRGKADFRRAAERTCNGIAWLLARRRAGTAHESYQAGSMWECYGCFEKHAQESEFSSSCPGTRQAKHISKERTERALDKLGDVERIRIKAAADIGAVYYTIRSFVFRQPGFIVDGELLPVLRKSFLGYGNAWRRELASFDLEPEDVQPSLADYLARKESGSNGTGAHQSPAVQPRLHRTPPPRSRHHDPRRTQSAAAPADRRGLSRRDHDRAGRVTEETNLAT